MKIPKRWIRFLILIVLIGLVFVIYFKYRPKFSALVETSADNRHEMVSLEHYAERDSNFLLRYLSDTNPQDLVYTITPPIVHYVWCQRQFFEFKHYLSVLSVHKILRPDKIYFHYAADPLIDFKKYNLWILNLKKEIPFIVFKQIPSCGDNARSRMNIVVDLLVKHGGTYVNETIIINENMQVLRNLETSFFVLADDSLNRFNQLLGGVFKIPPYFQLTPDFEIPLGNRCENPSHIDQSSQRDKCISLSNLDLFPRDIWDGDGPLKETIRQVFYGQSKPMLPVPSSVDQIPLLAHYVWMEGLEVTFLAYLSIMSTINILKVDAVFLHGNKPPTGELWKVVKDHPKVHFVYRELPEFVYTNEISDLPHVSDILRVDILLKYGGIYTDWDAVWVKPIDDLRGYDAVVGLDWPDWHPPWPDKINAGVLLAKKNAMFLQYVLETWTTYDHTADWYYHGLLQPYRVAERHPDTVRIDRRLQVICFEYKCHPVWKPGYKDANIHHLNGSPFDWKTDVYAVHWTRPDPPEFKNEETLRQSNTMFAEIGKHVLGIE